MKNFQFIICALFLGFTLSANASTKYEEAMLSAIDKLYQAHSPEDFQAAANTFDRIAKKETDKWHPLYYSAYAHVILSTMIEGNDKKDEQLDQALALVKAAKELQPNNSEIVAMEGFVHMLRIPIDPATRGQQYSGMAFGSLQKAVALDPENPRALMLLSDMQMGTARFFGNGTTEACNTLHKALELYETFQPAGTLDPTWGQNWAEQKKKECE